MRKWACPQILKKWEKCNIGRWFDYNFFFFDREIAQWNQWAFECDRQNLALQVSKDYMGHILHKILGVKNFWLPHLVTLDNKQNRNTTSQQWFTTERRVHWNTPETETVKFTCWACYEDGENCPVGRNSDGHRFLGFTRCDIYRLPREW